MAQNTIPVISTIPALAQWQAGLRQTLKTAIAPPVVANFSVASKQGGNYLTWAVMKAADGYQVEISSAGDFSTLLTSIQLPGNSSTAYFDTVPTSAGGAPAIRYYRVRATAGTTKAPQSVLGKPTSVLSSTAIAPNDTVTASTSKVDTSNLDKLNVGSSGGNYRDRL